MVDDVGVLVCGQVGGLVVGGQSVGVEHGHVGRITPRSIQIGAADLVVVPQALVAGRHRLPHRRVVLLFEALDGRERALVLRDDVAGAAVCIVSGMGGLVTRVIGGRWRQRNDMQRRCRRVG